MKTIIMDYETYLKEIDKKEWLKQLNKDLLDVAHHNVYERINKSSVDFLQHDITLINTGMLLLVEEINKIFKSQEGMNK